MSGSGRSHSDVERTNVGGYRCRRGAWIGDRRMLGMRLGADEFVGSPMIGFGERRLRSQGRNGAGAQQRRPALNARISPVSRAKRTIALLSPLEETRLGLKIVG